MRRLLLAAGLILCSSTLFSQTKPFMGELRDEEHHIFLKINLYDKDITIPGQSIYGNLPGYLGNSKSNYIWMITKSEMPTATKATIQLINDFGSEDATCSLIQDNDSTYTLKQEEGSTIKMVENRKYVKLPKVIILKRKK